MKHDAKRFVSVCSPAPRCPPRGGFVVRIHTGRRIHDVLARVGPACPGADEHFAVDSDVCADPQWVECADVLHGRYPRPPAEAVGRLTDMVAAHPSCRVAAVPLVGGGWAVSDGTNVLSARQVAANQPLVASCLHGWLAAGRTLRDITDLRVLRCGSRP
ncbi:hypothetical protein [Streptomyces sp. SGAir0957]